MDTGTMILPEDELRDSVTLAIRRRGSLHDNPASNNKDGFINQCNSQPQQKG